MVSMRNKNVMGIYFLGGSFGWLLYGCGRLWVWWVSNLVIWVDKMLVGSECILLILLFY